jgi:uncharacterized membrane protein YcaP (DUF421 family)
MRPDIWWSAGPATLLGAFLVAIALYVIVVLAFRLGKRRTVAELAPFDLAAVIAVGAIAGRTATGGNSVAVGITAVTGLLVGHWSVSHLRRLPAFRSLVDHPPAVLVLDGRVCSDELRRAGLTRGDLDAALRNHGVRDLADVTIAVFETRNGVSILTQPGRAPLWHHLSDSAPPDAEQDGA